MAYKVEIKRAEDEDGVHEYRNMLVINDGEIKRSYWDYGEPEDNSFHRDWKWVAKELSNAYAQGARDSKEGRL